MDGTAMFLSLWHSLVFLLCLLSFFAKLDFFIELKYIFNNNNNYYYIINTMHTIQIVEKKGKRSTILIVFTLIIS